MNMRDSLVVVAALVAALGCGDDGASAAVMDGGNVDADAARQGDAASSDAGGTNELCEAFSCEAGPGQRCCAYMGHEVQRDRACYGPAEKVVGCVAVDQEFVAGDECQGGPRESCYETSLNGEHRRWWSTQTWPDDIATEIPCLDDRDAGAGEDAGTSEFMVCK